MSGQYGGSAGEHGDHRREVRRAEARAHDLTELDACDQELIRGERAELFSADLHEADDIRAVEKPVRVVHDVGFEYHLRSTRQVDPSRLIRQSALATEFRSRTEHARSYQKWMQRSLRDVMSGSPARAFLGGHQVEGVISLHLKQDDRPVTEGLIHGLIPGADVVLSEPLGDPKPSDRVEGLTLAPMRPMQPHMSIENPELPGGDLREADLLHFEDGGLLALVPLQPVIRPIGETAAGNVVRGADPVETQR